METLAVFLVVLAVGQSHPVASDTPSLCTMFKPNDLVDHLLSDAKSTLVGPLPLPVVHWLGMTFQDGQAYGMDNVLRSSEATSSCIEDMMAVDVSVVNTEPLRGTYNWTKGLLGGEMDLMVQMMESKMTFTVSFDGQKPQVRLLDVVQLKDMSVQLTGLGILSPLMSSIATKMIDIFQVHVVKLMEKVMLEFMNKEIMERLLVR